MCLGVTAVSREEMTSAAVTTVVHLVGCVMYALCVSSTDYYRPECQQHTYDAALVFMSH